MSNTKTAPWKNIDEFIEFWLDLEQIPAYIRMNFLEYYQKVEELDETCILMLENGLQIAKLNSDEQIQTLQADIQALENAVNNEMNNPEVSLHKQVIQQADEDMKKMAQDCNQFCEQVETEYDRLEAES